MSVIGTKPLGLKPYWGDQKNQLQKPPSRTFEKTTGLSKGYFSKREKPPDSKPSSNYLKEPPAKTSLEETHMQGVPLSFRGQRQLSGAKIPNNP